MKLSTNNNTSVRKTLFCNSDKTNQCTYDFSEQYIVNNVGGIYGSVRITAENPVLYISLFHTSEIEYIRLQYPRDDINKYLYEISLLTNSQPIAGNNGGSIDSEVNYSYNDVILKHKSFTIPNSKRFYPKFVKNSNNAYIIEIDSESEYLKSNINNTVFLCTAEAKSYAMQPIKINDNKYIWILTLEDIINSGNNGFCIDINNKSGDDIIINKLAIYATTTTTTTIPKLASVIKNNTFIKFDTTNSILHVNYSKQYYGFFYDTILNTRVDMNFENGNEILLPYDSTTLGVSTVNRYLLYNKNTKEFKIISTLNDLDDEELNNWYLICFFFATINNEISVYGLDCEYYIDDTKFVQNFPVSDNSTNNTNDDIDSIFRNGRSVSYIDSQTKLNCTYNDNGTITIAADGYYFPGVQVHGYFNGDCHIRVTLIDKIHNILNAANTNVISGGGNTYYPFTLISKDDNTNRRVFYLKLTDADFKDDMDSYIIRIDNRSQSDDLIIESIEIVDSGIGNVASSGGNSISYVAATGNDTAGDGTKAKPYRTVTKALESGANYISIAGGEYNEAINFAKVSANNITLINSSPYNKCIFYPANKSSYVISESEELVSGYTKVYSATMQTAPADKWIYQHGIDDLSTEINNHERLPQERGMRYRCENTLIIPTTAKDLETALTEIENCTGNNYKYFADAENNIIYFCRPQPITTDNPLTTATKLRLFNGNNKDIRLTVIGIEAIYHAFNIDNFGYCKIIDCKSGYNALGGAFTYNVQVGSEFIRCEAVRCQSGSNGDGFNGHSSNSGDIYSKQTTVSLIDCWSHDNADDGYSDHERSEITIQGGLYEFNGKGGIVPSYGSHCTCYNVYSRYNYCGFYYTGTALEAEGGQYGQMLCFYCHAEKNNRGGSCQGFRVDGDYNRMELIGCTSIGNEHGGYACNSNNIVRLVDCKSLNETATAFANGADIEIVNTNIVSSN